MKARHCYLNFDEKKLTEDNRQQQNIVLDPAASKFHIDLAKAQGAQQHEPQQLQHWGSTGTDVTIDITDSQPGF